MGFIDGLISPVTNTIEKTAKLPGEAIGGAASAVGGVVKGAENIGETVLDDAQAVIEAPLGLLKGVEGSFSWLPWVIGGALILAAGGEYLEYKKS